MGEHVSWKKIRGAQEKVSLEQVFITCDEKMGHGTRAWDTAYYLIGNL